MIAEEFKLELKEHISRLYRELLLRPQMFSRPVTVESFVMALECILDFADSESRPESYANYLGEGGFGMHLFLSAFEMRKACVLTVVEQQQVEADPPSLESEYLAALKEHLKRFVAWRESRKPAGTSPSE